MWNPFKKKVEPAPTPVETPAPTTYEFTVPQPKQEVVTSTGSWKTGKWVVVNNRVGILAQITLPNVEIHFVDPNTGETTDIVTVHINALRMATYNEIPACRLGVTQAQARELGYAS